MKKVIKCLSLCLIPLFTACNVEYVAPGNVGILINMRGQEKGVERQVLPPGRYSLGWNEKLYVFPTVSQNYVYTKSAHEGSKENEEMTFQDKDGMSLSGDFGVTYNIVPDKVSFIFQKYGKGVEEITGVVIRNAVRDELGRYASQLPVETIYGSGKGKFIDDVSKAVHADLEPIGVNVERIYAVSDLRLPKTIIDAINAKLEQNQNNLKASAQIAEANAKAQKRLIEAQAEAEANLKVAKSITPEYLQYLWIERWDTHLPEVVAGAGAQPLLNLAVPQGRK